MADLSEEMLNTIEGCSVAIGATAYATRAMVAEIRRHRAAQTASAEQMRDVVLKIAGDVLEHPDSRILRAFDAASAIADRVAAQLTGAAR